ncbi:hypothetical protein HRH59_03925 [Rheinheimera sp. YQF-2]|uniref:Porin n=1 Tax=Rheinheimera lutimaris TaxID=2740584 RepID=A0A7Y5ANM0_9GAMM|nr:hypothetical protein [Rheinheimera lutimaris]NRQ41718.1 hypothetical protein [Rheinheimera lutimaris]
MNKALLRTVLLTVFMLFSSVTVAEDFSWQGFVAQGLIRADDSNYINNSGKTSAALTELGVNGRYSLAADWHLAGQVVYLDGGNRYPQGTRLDYLFLDWAFYNTEAWQANMYFGRFKNQHWLYSGTRDVPFTRPSIILPQSVYFDGFRDIAVGTDGLALQARNSGDYGDLTLNWSFGTIPISQQQSRQLLGYDTQGKTSLQRDHKLSVYWQPAFSRFSYGAILLDSAFKYRPGEGELISAADFTVQRVMLNLRYQAENWEFATELLQERIKTNGFFAPQFERQQLGQGGYMLAQYHYSPQLRFYTMLDYMVLDKDDRQGRMLERQTGGVVPRWFGYQHAVAVGVSVDISRQWRLHGETHWNKGTGRLAPVLQPDVLTNKSQYWQVLAVQLMYRF